MKTHSLYSVLLTSDVTRTAAFYRRHFDMVSMFAADWYASLATPGEPAFQLALLDPSHPSLPVRNLGASANLLLNFEVEDVDAVYSRLIRDAKLPVLLDLRDEPWGQRHFITSGPDGIMIDVIQPIPPSPEFTAQYSEAGRAENEALVDKSR
jgi:catechol 2,3-dioxygenase-like lactoylglutathione lyase family enzyme